MNATRTMTRTEEAAWFKAMLDDTLFPYREESESSEQMWLWRMAGHTLKEIGRVYGVATPTVWARVRNYEERQA